MNNMHKINILIAKRGRDDYLKVALHNFNQADNTDKYDIEVYIGEDIEENLNKIDYSIYDNLKVQHLHIPNLPQAGDLFCRGHLMDMLLRRMRQDYDFICIADTDMVYRKSFFDEIISLLGDGNNKNLCLDTSGFYTDKNINYKKILHDNSSYEEILSDYSHVKHPPTSQISITKSYHEFIKNKLSIKSIYDTGSLGYYFMGWGREDTLVQKIMDQSKVKVTILQDSWVHIWHASQARKEGALLYNSSIMALLNDEIKERFRAKEL